MGKWVLMLVVVSIIIAVCFIALGVYIAWCAAPVLPRNNYKQGRIQRYTDYAISDSVHLESALKNWNGAFSLFTLNLGFATGMDQFRFHELSKSTITDNLNSVCDYLVNQRLDIAAFQEIDFDSNRSHTINQAEYIAKKAGYPYVAIAYTWNQRRVPYPSKWNTAKQFGKTVAGHAILSKYPIVAQRIIRFSKPASNSMLYNMFYLDRIAQIVDIQLPDKTIISVVNIHLEAYDARHRSNQMRYLLSKITPKNTLILGDFNSLPPGTDPITGYPDEPDVVYDDDVINQVQSVFHSEAFEPVGESAAWTFPSNTPNRRLDYVFFSDDFEKQNAHVTVLQPEPSDHRGVAVFLKKKR